MILKKIKAFPTWKWKKIRGISLQILEHIKIKGQVALLVTEKDKNCLPNHWYWFIVKESLSLRFLFHCFACACFVCMFICTPHDCSTHRGQQRSLDDCQPWYGCYKPKLGPLKKEPVPLISRTLKGTLVVCEGGGSQCGNFIYLFLMDRLFLRYIIFAVI